MVTFEEADKELMILTAKTSKEKTLDALDMARRSLQAWERMELELKMSGSDYIDLPELFKIINHYKDSIKNGGKKGDEWVDAIVEGLLKREGGNAD